MKPGAHMRLPPKKTCPSGKRGACSPQMNREVEEYISQRTLSRDYERDLRRTVERLASIGVSSLTGPSVSVVINKWLASIQNTNTRAKSRRAVVTLCHACGWNRCRSVADSLVRVKTIVPPPVAYTMKEMEKLLESARNEAGFFRSSGCSRALWCESFILACYETGLRFSDVFGLHSSSVRGQRLSVVQHKTGRFIHKRISSRLAHLLSELSSKSSDGSIFSWAVKVKWGRAALRKCWKRAGLPGTPKFLRRTGATMCEAMERGSAREFLGHLSIGLAERHYIDSSLLPERCPSPPFLSSSG